MNRAPDDFCWPADQSRGAVTFRATCEEFGLDVEVCRWSLNHLDDDTHGRFNAAWSAKMYALSGVNPAEPPKRPVPMAGREDEVVSRKKAGQTQARIAREMDVSLRTVQRVLKKAGVFAQDGRRNSGNRRSTQPKNDAE